MWATLSIVLGLGFLVSAVACGALAVARRSVAAERDRLAQHLAAREAERDALSGKVGELNTELAVIREQRAQIEKQAEQIKAQYKQAQEAARDQFKAVADEVLERSNKRFLQLADENFKGKQTQAEAALAKREQAIKSLVDPIKQSLDQYKQAVQQIEAARKQAYGELTSQVKGLGEAQQHLSRETRSLGQALRRPEVRGRWGEMQLRRVAELAGMIQNCDFYEQEVMDGGSKRPDMVVKLPGDRSIVVDAKTPFDAYVEAAETEDDAKREELLDRHTRQVETQVRNLASKAYQRQFDRSPDFVVLFIPGESFLHAAVQRKPELIEKAMQSNVVIATPTTLISLLKAVAAGWREQQVAENAKRISELGQELHKRLCTALAHLENLGKAVGKTVEHYNKFLGSMESQVLPQARRFQELGADSRKELPASLEGVDTTTRAATKIEAADHA